DAVQSQGLDARRLLLIGGAARNPAVREGARDIFTVPIDVPEQAEYVAIGAARQAAWTLTGRLPKWPVELVATLHPRPSRVRQQYRSYPHAATSPTPREHAPPTAQNSLHQHRRSSDPSASAKGREKWPHS